MRFYIGISERSWATHFRRCMISVRRLARTVRDFDANEWMMDSGAFTQITRFGHHESPAWYADQIRRWSRCGQMVCAVAQDFMCEQPALDATGSTVGEHIGLTVHYYVSLMEQFGWQPPVHIMPTLQGYEVKDYLHCMRQYGPLLKPNMWVGVGSVCKRNRNPQAILEVVGSIHRERPDLKLHGFGVKLTALKDPAIRNLLWSADSMAWSFNARINGRDQNDPKEARAWADRMAKIVGEAA